MNSRMRRAASSLWPAVLVLVAASVAYTEKPAARTGEAAAPPPQDVTRIESRLSHLEQRFYTLETTLRGLEQISRLPSVTTGAGARDPEIGLLRVEVEALRRRLTEIECGLAKLDERTLTTAARDARRKSAPGAGDPCRLDTEAPLRLPTRP